MYTARVFKSGNSQAIRIPKEIQTKHSEFEIRSLGEGFVLFPKDDPWFPLRESIGTLPDDFERDQPSCSDAERREDL